MITSESENVSQLVSHGHLPAWSEVEALTTDAYEQYLSLDEGEVADYIPLLATSDPRLFGLAVTEANGALHDVGDSAHLFSIQSISKAFVYALVCNEYGHSVIKERVGVNNTGLSFNSVMALELNGGHPMNPMVNAGAIATTAMMPGDTAEEKWEQVRTGLSAFAGRELVIDSQVYESETATNLRNRAIAHLLKSNGRIDSDPLEMVDIYTKQCATLVNARDLSIMGATLADGGVNPITGERVVSAAVCRDTLAVLATSGMYERSGEWLFEIGIPAKSGVAGGIVAVAPGKGAIGAFSPRLDSAGNSVRGQRSIAYLSRALGLNLFASTPTQSIEKDAQ